MSATAEYQLSVDPPHSIYITTEHVEAVLGALPNSHVEDDGKIVVSFTKENALLLRSLLRGRDVSLSAKDRAILAWIADDHSKVSKKFAWSRNLVDLPTIPLNNKTGKIKTAWDLLHYLPLRFIDKTNPQNVDQLKLGDWSVIVGEIINEVKYDHYRDMLKIVVADINGRRISASFFRQPWFAKKFKKGDEVILYGNYSEYVNQSKHYPQITNASIDKITDIRGELPMIPIYPQKNGDKTQRLQKQVTAFLSDTAWIEDPVPSELLKLIGLPNRNTAYRNLHLPQNSSQMIDARKRLAFDEFLRLQIYFNSIRNEIENIRGASKETKTLSDIFIESLPYELTNAQLEAIREIREDLSASSPMYRLLQGDVGSGKSIVAEVAAVQTVENGYQVAFLAPTDVLATQMFERVQTDLEKANLSNISIELLTGRVKGKKRETLINNLKQGALDIVIGTHALLQPTVEFLNLGLAIIDEQHKYGTKQRDYLRRANENNGAPDMLLMSATPIPRTTSQVVYGDMDISIVNELPPGRLPIKTFLHSTTEEAWFEMRQQISQGHQAYVIAALVEDSETLEDIESATTMSEKIRSDFPGTNVGLLHGRLTGEEKNAVLKDFSEGKIEILVSTSVVEVGVDVKNATCMTILNANRFGIASLHQIRGRVGRNNLQSYCFLVGDISNAEAEERLNALVASNDGFWLAEKDLEIRGEGNLFGQQQSGQGSLYAANLRNHLDLLEIAKNVASKASKSEELKHEVEFLYKDKRVSA